MNYTKTKVSDYQGLDDKVFNTIDSAHYLGNKTIADEVQYLINKGIIIAAEADLIFGEGYAMKRNIVLYFALKNRMDYLLFLDEYEYPIALLNVEGSIAWKGQAVIATHLKYLAHANMTHGHHCDYVSPIPCIRYTVTFEESDFKMLIEAIRNELINWDSVKQKMEDGGITWVDLDLMIHKKKVNIKEIQGMKFISGANLGFNLSDTTKIY